MADWLDIDSSHVDSYCGKYSIYTLENALNGSGPWWHKADEEHWFILDLGDSYTITKVRGRSEEPVQDLGDPTDVNIYVSDDKENWGSAVATGISTWQDTDVWQEVNVTEKSGRYVKVEIIDTSDNNDHIYWGRGTSPFTIFDVYGGLPPEKPINPTPANAVDNITLDQETLTWEDGGGATSYNVYYGTSEAGLALVSGGQTGLSFTIDGIDDGSPFANSASRVWRIDAINDTGTTTGDVWIFRTVHSNTFPWERSDDYDPDLEWDWDDTGEEYAWIDIELTGGGRYKNQIVAVGHNTVYFGSI